MFQQHLNVIPAPTPAACVCYTADVDKAGQVPPEFRSDLRDYSKDKGGSQTRL